MFVCKDRESKEGMDTWLEEECIVRKIRKHDPELYITASCCMEILRVKAYSLPVLGD